MALVPEGSGEWIGMLLSRANAANIPRPGDTNTVC